MWIASSNAVSTADRALASSVRITDDQAKSSRSGGSMPERSIAFLIAARPAESDRSNASWTFAVSSDRQIAAYPWNPSSSKSTAADAASRPM